ncbi:hypothetical protein DPMN_072352 [Dreissena polymorpha]|uniref:Uncharacterized protein n=1 Tax=Dreissena polymorpha TaxID=45954 RepID=A0A9D3Z8K0_DREPO|nr:hypothetical protein DPMN_072352 [Dreissena polymorpha]
MNLVLQPCRPVVLWNDTISKPLLRHQLVLGCQQLSASELYVLGSAAGLEPFSDQGTGSLGSLLVQDHLMHYLTAPSMSASALNQRI